MSKQPQRKNMKLYLIQHAEAKREEEDPSRPLSEKGWEDIKKVKEYLKEKGIKVKRIFHSDKLRAKQTAEALSEVIYSSEGIDEEKGLAPLDDSNIWFYRLKTEMGDVMIVGHLPYLSILAGLLLSDDPERKIVNFKGSGVVCVKKDEAGKWSVQWMMIPEIL